MSRPLDCEVSSRTASTGPNSMHLDSAAVKAGPFTWGTGGASSLTDWPLATARNVLRERARPRRPSARRVNEPISQRLSVGSSVRPRGSRVSAAVLGPAWLRVCRELERLGRSLGPTVPSSNLQRCGRRAVRRAFQARRPTAFGKHLEGSRQARNGSGRRRMPSRVWQVFAEHCR